jgi:hypothetical protein
VAHPRAEPADGAEVTSGRPKLRWILVPWEILAFASLAVIPKLATTDGAKSVGFIIWWWCLFGPLLAAIVITGRARDPKVLRPNPDILRAGYALLIGFGAVGLGYLFVDVRLAQVFLFIAAVGLTVVLLRRPTTSR